jgi:hypothetical protein
MNRGRYTINYRVTEARQVMRWIKASQSGCLVGLRGAGKSNFLRFLLRSDVQQHYLGPDDTDFIFILVEMLSLTEHSEWAVYELILDRLLNQLRSLWPEENIEEMASLLREVRQTRDSLTAQRAIERCMDILCQRPEQRIVLFFDEFNAVFRDFNPSLFRCLRAIRDAHKEQVSYIVVVTDDLTYLRDDLGEIEHFYRLVSRNVCGLGPYSDDDARQMIRYLASTQPIEIDKEVTIRLLKLSGGHAGLLKAMLSRFWDVSQTEELAAVVPTLVDEPVVQAECRKVWTSLSETQQAALIPSFFPLYLPTLSASRLLR